MSHDRISESTRIRAAAHPVSTATEEETVVLDPERSRYYALAGVGQRVWSLLQEPCTLGELRDAVVAAYDVEPARCLEDLRALVRQFDAAGLVVLDDEVPS